MPKETGARSTRWLYSVLPVSMATGPLGTVVALYLIHLDGQVLGTIYVGLAAAFYNGISIPAALIWGMAIDKLQKRRALIVLGYAITSIALVSFYFVASTAGAIAVYSIVAFVSFASATPLNLLIMETEAKSRWAGAFAELSMISSVGNVAGLLLSTVWSDVIPASQLAFLFIPMGVLSMVSAGLSLATIKEPVIVLERETLAMRRPSFFTRLLANPIFFLVIPSASDFKRAFRGIRSSLTRQVPLFYISTVLFYASAGLFNTSFVPALSFFSLPDQEVFAIILMGMAVQTLSFQAAGRFVGVRSLIRTSIQGLMLRGWSYVGIGAAALFLTGAAFAVSSAVLYALAGGLAYAIYYTSANTMMFTTIRGKSAGAALGVYSAVVGISAMVGSLLSGVISVDTGYHSTFVLSGILLFAAVGIVGRLPKPSSPDESSLQ